MLVELIPLQAICELKQLEGQAMALLTLSILVYPYSANYDIQ